MAKTHDYAASLDEADQVEFAHLETGQRYGGSVKAFRDLYEPLGYEIVTMGDGTLPPGHPDAPDPATIPADNSVILPDEVQPAPAEGGVIRVSDLSDTERATLKAQGVDLRTRTIEAPTGAGQTPTFIPDPPVDGD